MKNTIYSILNKHVPSRGQRFAIIDFPDYANVGDSAIWLGTIKYFENRHRLRPSYVCSQIDFNEDEMKEAIGEDGIIYIMGGGNLGDLWPNHQEFREKIMTVFNKHKIVQLPQSIHFTNQVNEKRFRDTVDQCGNFFMMVRDKQSYDSCSDLNCNVALCPDMAYYMDYYCEANTSNDNQLDLLMLLRTDKEAKIKDDILGSYTGKVQTHDWNTEPQFDKTFFAKILDTAVSGFLGIDRQPARLESYNFKAHNRLNRGIELLTSGKFVITDRLHGHILCELLNIPHAALDNSYGKVHGYIKTWNKDSKFVSVCDTLDQALETWKARK